MGGQPLRSVDPSPGKQANVTWMLRWESQEARAAGFKRVFESDAWKAVWHEHPDANGYIQMSARSMDAM